MEPSRGRAADTLERRLYEAGYGFDFFQAVRLLMRLNPVARPVGYETKPSDEVVRFGTRVSLEFPASAVHEVERPQSAGSVAHMTISFFGLMGTQGVLPLHYTEHMLARGEAGDKTMAEFLNVFNHRWISLFYKVWEKHRLPVAYERSALEGKKLDRISRYVFDLVGMGTAGLRDRMSVPDTALILYAGLISQRPRSASALRGVLRDYFRIPVVIREFLGSWYALDEADRSRMMRNGLHNQLGIGAVAGDEVWDQQSRFTIRLGPLRMERFRAFLPDGNAIQPLRDLTRFFIGIAMAFDVQLVLQQDDVPACSLVDDAGAAPRLGWNTWLKLDEFRHHPDDATFVEVA